MKGVRRSLIALALAALVPVVVFAVVLVVLLGMRAQDAIEARALSEVRQIAADIERFVAAQLKAIETLAHTTALRRGDFEAVYDDAQRIKGHEPLWVTLMLSDAEHNQILNLARPLGERLPMVESPSLQAAITSGRSVVGDFQQGDGIANTGFVPIHVPVIQGGAVKYIITVALDPRGMDKLFTRSEAPADWIGAVVDSEGHVIGRSIRAADFVGHLAGPAVLSAVKSARHGIYEGRTLEQLEMVFAFYTSPLTGWSVHYAVPRDQYEAPLRRTLWIVIPSGLGVVALAAFLAMLVGRDIAHRRRLEAARMQSQKLEALGQFTGGIAHDFNNLLTAILGNLDLAAKRLAEHPALKYVERAQQGALRGAKLNEQLLGFARKQHMEPRVGHLNPIIEAADDLLHSTMGGTIAIRTHLQPDLWPALIDPTQIEMALVNLCLNARDAMPRGGTLTIQTANLSAGDGRLPPGHHDRDHVMLEVKDTGIGMNETVRRRVLEPFFTTKSVGRGTGLGLSHVHGVVHQLGGALTIDSAPRAGTTVRVLLPRSEVAETTSIEQRPPVLTGADFGMRVLLVDDDDDVRATASAMLQNLGCRVQEASDGETALRALTADGVDVLITDYAMPTMAGTELIRKVHAARRDLPIIMMTGYVDSIADTSAITVTLRKPFTSADVAAALSRCESARSIVSWRNVTAG